MVPGDIAPANGMANIANLVSLFKGKSGTQTTSNNITPEGIQYLIQQQLAGNSGLAAISSGQKSAGIYNSTARSQLSNDLLARATGEAATRGATTTTKTKQDAALGIPDLLTMFALAKGGGALSGDLGLGKVAGAAKDFLGIGKSASGAFTPGVDVAGEALGTAAPAGGFVPGVDVLGEALGTSSGASSLGASLGNLDFLSGAGYLAAGVNGLKRAKKFGDEGDTGGALGEILGTVGGGMLGGPLGAIGGSAFGGQIGSSASKGAAQVEDAARGVITGAGDAIAGIFGW